MTNRIPKDTIKIMKQVYEIEVYENHKGESPFHEWLLGLKDRIAQVKIHARIDRVSLGNFGDHKEIKGAKGLYEMREHYGQGYRIYYTKIGKKVIILLVGSAKKDQNKAIKKAKEYLEDYRKTQNND